MSLKKQKSEDIVNKRTMENSKIEILDGSIFIENTLLYSPKVAKILDSLETEEEKKHLLVQLLEMGSITWESIQSSSMIKTVEEEIGKISGHFRSDLAETLEREHFLSREKMQELLLQSQNSMDQLFLKYIDENNNQSFPQLMQKKIEESYEQIFEQMQVMLNDKEDGALGKMKQELLGEFREQVDRLIRNHAEKTALIEKSNLSGWKYEELVENKIREYTKITGDWVENCGSTPGILRRKNGDLLLTINTEQEQIYKDLKIVFECKKRKETESAFSINEMRNSLQIARKNREAQAGIFVVDSMNLLPGQESFINLGPSDWAVAYDENVGDIFLSFCYRIARESILVVKGSNVDTINTEEIQQYIQQVQNKLANLSQVYSSLQLARNGIDKSVGILQETQDDIAHLLQKVHLLLK